MTSPIPKPWKAQVVAILRTGNLDRILIRKRTQDDFQSLFPGAFRMELLDCLADALALDALEGRLVTGMKEPGTVYEFIFLHSSVPIYSKINLCPDGSVIIIYSAHRPLKGNSL